MARLSIAWDACLEAWPQHAWLRRVAYSVAAILGSTVAIGLVVIWVPSAWQWAFEVAGQPIAQFLVVGGGILGGIAGLLYALDNPPWKWMLNAGTKEAARGGDFVRGASSEYQSWKLVYVLVGVVIGAIAGGIAGLLFTVLIAIILAFVAFLAAAAVGALFAVGAGLIVVLVVSAVIFVDALVRNHLLTAVIVICVIASLVFSVTRSGILNEGLRVRVAGLYRRLFPENRIEKVWVEHNVFDSSQKGMRIHIAARITHRQGVACGAAAYFYEKDGNPLKDSDGSYRSADGLVSVGVELSPGSDVTDYDDLAMFLPYAQLHLNAAVRHDLKLQVSLYEKGGSFFASSEWTAFWFGPT